MRMSWLAASLMTATAAHAAVPNYDFTYSYPAQAARIPALRAWLEGDRARLRAATARDAARAEREAKKDGFPYRRYETVRKWQVVTDTPRFLSLSGDVYTYTGGAHGSPATLSMVWDKAAGRRLAPQDVFASPAALEAATRPAWCAKLKVLQRARRGDVGAGGPFDACPRLKELVVLLGSSGGGRINRIGLIADPYVAGSFAEGRYEATLSVTPTILQAVKPAYRAAFAIR